jgi:oxygen-independent coproporphyrinogen-3 oxidase
VDFSVYVHTPFCRVQCPYCTFFTLLRPHDDAPMRRLMQGVRTEWERRVVPRLRAGGRLATLYLGGGTPSDLPDDALVGFLRSALQDVPGGAAAVDEITVECNPESATPPLLDALCGLGVGRVSLGVQSLDDADLRRLGRGHGAAEAQRALGAVAARFTTWNADLILGIPDSRWQRVADSLAALVDAGAPHLSLYCLELPPGRARRFGDPQTDVSEDAKADLYERASAWIAARGFEHYEISNAARPGHRARHNSAYWRGAPYVGLGPGAHSYDGQVRRANVSDLERYLQALSQGDDAPHTSETLTPAMRHAEALLTGLRLADGVPLAGHGLAAAQDLLGRLEGAGLAVREAGRLRLTPRGWMISDSIILQIVTATSPGPGAD